MIIFIILIAALIMGSFIGCVALRFSVGESLFKRSKCPKCHKNLQVKNLFPLFSFLLQQGKCSNCKAKISLYYPLIELFFVAIFLAIYFVFDKNLNSNYTLICMIASVMIAIAIIDIKQYFIPNILQIILAFLIILFLAINLDKSGVKSHFLAAIFYGIFAIFLYFLFYFMAGLEAIGVDDIKFFAVAGLLLGMQNFVIFIFLLGIFGIIFGLIWKKIMQDLTFPFAPALCLACFLSFVLDEKFNLSKMLNIILLQ